MAGVSALNVRRVARSTARAPRRSSSAASSSVASAAVIAAAGALLDLIRDAGFRPVERNTRYEVIREYDGPALTRRETPQAMRL